MNRLIRYSLLASLLLSLFSFGFASKAFAQDPAVPYESVNPNEGLKYGLKRLKEKVALTFFSFSAEKKADYYQELTKKRLAELHYVIDKKDEDSFEASTKRYFTTVGQYAEFLKSKNLADKKSAAIEMLKSHEPILEKLRDAFHSSSAQWRFVQDDINYVKEYISILSS